MTSKSYPKWLPAALDYVPLLIFFAAYKILGIFSGTAVFMVAISIAAAISYWKVGRVSPMMWMSATLVIIFGGLTIYFHDQSFIQKKPTIIYSILSAMLFIGLLRGKPMLKYVLEHGYHGLSDAGWLILSRNWAWFFAAMAVANEILRHIYATEAQFGTWLAIKVYGMTAASFLFAMANVPMLMKHGFGDSPPPAGEDPKSGDAV
jgi:intracellular septation protein